MLLYWFMETIEKKDTWQQTFSPRWWDSDALSREIVCDLKQDHKIKPMLWNYCLWRCPCTWRLWHPVSGQATDCDLQLPCGDRCQRRELSVIRRTENNQNTRDFQIFLLGKASIVKSQQCITHNNSHFVTLLCLIISSSKIQFSI